MLKLNLKRVVNEITKDDSQLSVFAFGFLQMDQAFDLSPLHFVIPLLVYPSCGAIAISREGASVPKGQESKGGWSQERP